MLDYFYYDISFLEYIVFDFYDFES